MESAAKEEAANAGRPPGKACSTMSATGPAAGSPTGAEFAPAADSDASAAATDLAAAADATPRHAASDDWRHFVTLYGWVPSFRGTTKVKGVKAKPSLSRSDIWNHLDIAFMGRYEVMPPNSDWSFWLDMFYSSLEDDASASTQLSRIDADFNVRMSFIELAAAYHMWRSDKPMDGLQKQAARTQVDAFAGARYARMRMQVDLDAPTIGAGFKFDENEDWVDPFIGLRARHGLSPDWWLTVRGDVGGFDIGTSSKFAWTATGTVQHLLTPDLSIGAGWKIMDIDYQRSDFEVDIQMSGPFVTLTYQF